MNKGKPKATIINPLPRNKVVLAVSILLILIFSKYFYMASISSYYTFYLMQKFGLSIQNAQLHLFAFLFAVAAGTVIGGPVGDKIGAEICDLGLYPRRCAVYADFTLRQPALDGGFNGDYWIYPRFGILCHSGLRSGAASGTYRYGFWTLFRFCFWYGGLGAAVLGLIADHTSIELVYKICAFLPLLGMLTIFLPITGIKTDFIAAKGKLWLHRFTVAISLSSVKPPSVFRSVLFLQLIPFFCKIQ